MGRGWIFDRTDEQTDTRYCNIDTKLVVSLKKKSCSSKDGVINSYTLSWAHVWSYFRGKKILLHTSVSVQVFWCSQLYKNLKSMCYTYYFFYSSRQRSNEKMNESWMQAIFLIPHRRFVISVILNNVLNVAINQFPDSRFSKAYVTFTAGSFYEQNYFI